MIRDAIDREVEAVDSGQRSVLCLNTFPFIEPVIYLAHLSFSISLYHKGLN